MSLSEITQETTAKHQDISGTPGPTAPLSDRIGAGCEAASPSRGGVSEADGGGSYFQKRMTALGITDAINQVMLWHLKIPTEFYTDSNGAIQNVKELKSFPVFKPHPRGIEIFTWGLDRRLNTYQNQEKLDKEGRIVEKRGWRKPWSIIRLEKPIIKDDGDQVKYLMPKGHGSHILISPNILEAYDKRQEIHTLVLTEGFFKCWKGYMAGLHIIGLPSITHMKSADKKTIHPEITELIEKCNIRHIIWLTDGDALDISKDLETISPDGTKKLKDLYTRPHSFYSSISTFSQLLYDYKNVRKFFAYIDINNIMSTMDRGQWTMDSGPLTVDQLKGLDDLLITLPEKQTEIINDLLSISHAGFFFQKFDISIHTGKVLDHFHLDNPTRFYLHHIERRSDLKGRSFIFHGTQYKYNDDTGECDIEVPARAKDYFRVGDDYYKILKIPNKYRQLEQTFKGRRKGTIMDDHGKDFTKHIPKYESFCNVPDNTNFQNVIHNCYNVYSPLDFRPDEDPCTEEDCPTIISFIHHIFGDRTVSFKHPKTHDKHEYKTIDLALDYLQILYQHPAEKLPILCLISKENNTGKSTFGYLLRSIFGSNVAIVGNQDLAGDFNAHWATKLIVICDEAKIDKQHVVEKVKSLSTANKITMNAKGKDHVEIDCFIKFIFITNNEDNFIYMSDEDIRYWIIKVPVIKEENPNIMQQFIEEIPAFLSYLNQRTIKTERLGRMWFYPSLLKTEAMKKVIEFSRSTVQKEIRQRIRDMFFDFGVTEILMTRAAIHKEFFNNRHEANYIERVIKEEMKVDQYWEPHPTEKDLFEQPKKIYKVKRHTYPRWEEQFKESVKQIVRAEVQDNGRPYVFRREEFLTAEEIQRLHIDPQTQFENKMFSSPGALSPSRGGVSEADGGGPGGGDDLPF